MKTSVIAHVAWISLIPHFFVLIALCFFMAVFFRNPVLPGALAYLVLSFAIRRSVPRGQHKGIIYLNEGKHMEAISCFEESYRFFQRYSWLDRFRYWVLLNSSAVSYREMALNNIAFTYGQMGNGEKAKEYYEKTLLEFPDSTLARAGLNLLNAGANIK